ncbi:MAG TPA: S8 family serine peptidase [bacterium]
MAPALAEHGAPSPGGAQGIRASSGRRGAAAIVALWVAVLAPLPSPVRATEAAPGLRARLPPPKPAHTRLLARQSREAIEVKFAQGGQVRLREGCLTSLDGRDLVGVHAVLSAHSVEAVERLFPQPEAEIARERHALEELGGEELPDLNLWYRLRVAPGADIESLIDALNALPEVEIAYAAPLPSPPPGDPGIARMSPFAGMAETSTPDFSTLQGYVKTAPEGIDATFAWTKADGSGGRVTIVDVEYSFNPAHEDLPSVPLISGVFYQGWGSDHGTAVLGELAGVANGLGVRGIASAASLKFASPCPNTSCRPYAPAAAINAARLATSPGDVILIEQQTSACSSGYGPLEWIWSVRDAIKTATAGKRIVVQAAGNGAVDLDSPNCLGVFGTTANDSGAIIVGAGAPPGYTQNDRSRLSYSSFGRRVDVQGWGFRVVTTGYGDLHAGSGVNQWYSDSFSGTSSAASIVAGAAALLSGITRQRGSLLLPARVRFLLSSTGSPQQDAPGFPASQHIGPRPNLKRAIVELERPRPLSPGGTIADPTPAYRWTKVPGASKYQVEISAGGTPFCNRVVGTAACATGVCTATPSLVVAAGVYSWRVRAYLDTWKSWSASKSFDVSP